MAHFWLTSLLYRTRIYDGNKNIFTDVLGQNLELHHDVNRDGEEGVMTETEFIRGVYWTKLTNFNIFG